MRVFPNFCTYIGERTFYPRLQQTGEEASTDMYDTTRRVELVKRQIRKNTRRRQKRGIGRLSAVCMLLFAALMQTADRVVGQGQTAAWGGFGAMLLREDAGGYVLVGVAAFTAAVVLTVVCMRLHEREKQKRKHEEDAT